MKQWIKDLLDLQGSDMRIKKMKNRLVGTPDEKNVVLDDLEKQRNSIEETKDLILHTEREIKQIEAKIDDVKSKILNFQSKSAMVKKNDEYKALMGEIDNCKRKIDEFENSQIELIDKQEENRKKQNRVKRIFHSLEKTTEDHIEEICELEESIKSEIKSITAKRSTKVKKIPVRTLSVYTRLLNGIGEPMVKMHNGNCGHCHLKLTPQTINDVKKEQLISCDTCGHLLYTEEA